MTPSKNKSNQTSAAAKDPQQELRRKTLMAALVLSVPFLGVMYLIFGGGPDSPAPGQNSLNMSVPEGRSPGIEASKQKALERVTAERQQTERTRLFDDQDFSLLAQPAPAPQPAVPEAVARSQQAHRQAQQAVSGFYTSPAPDPQVEELRRQVQQLTEQLEAQPPAADPLVLAEKQYALAAKYLHGSSGTAAAAVPTQTVAAEPVRSARASVVSSLAPPRQDSTRGGFITPVGEVAERLQGGIRVCVDEQQTLVSGERIRLRLRDAILVAGREIPAGSILYGLATIGGQRMKVQVSGIHYRGEVLPVRMDAYDLDGGEGLYIPDSDERTALKDAAAAIGSSFGSSISFTRGAGQQVAMDIARGAMTGGTQYLASKLRQVKVTVKAGYQIIFLSKE